MNARYRNFDSFAKGSGRLLAVLAIAVSLATATVIAAIGLTDRAEREFESRAALQVTYETQLFEVFTRSLLQRFDQVLMLLREEVLEDGPPRDIATWSTRRGVLREPLFQIAVIGADGKLLATTENASSIGVDLSDREHFRVHRETDTDRMFISKPLVGRASGRLSLNISRPVRNAESRFLGVVVVSVDPQLFSDFLEILGEPNNAVVNLFGQDGIIRARAPSVPGQQFIGGSIAGFEVEDLVKASSEGRFRAVSRLDKVERIFAFRRLDDLSLTVLVGKNTDAVFADFYEQRRLYLTIGFVSAAFVVGLAVLFEIYLRAQDRIRVGEALVALQNQQTTDLIGIMDGCGAALVQTDALGQIAICNSTFATMFGIADRGALVGRPFDTIVAAGGLTAAQFGHFNKIQSAAAYPVRFELSFMLRDSTSMRRDIMWSWTQSKTGIDPTIRFIGVGIDNTELRAKEMMFIQSAKLASLGRLAATLNHEMVQPLNVVRLGLANLKTLIERNAPKDDLLARAGKAIDNIQRTGSILTRFRSLIRQDRNVVEIAQLADAIHAAIGMYEEQFRIDGISLIVETDVACELECSRIELEQVFVNLLANAYDAILRFRSNEKAIPGSSQARSPDIVRIRIEMDPGAPEIVRILVEDSGGGIPADIIANVFQPFFTTRSNAGGTGLGLAICRATVESLKGTIELSNASRGARFVVSLPIRTNATTAPVSA
jgi:C4-dicarboxylate-specific signal transduction histidine kinase